MFDFWLTMGSIVGDPSVLPALTASSISFTPVTATITAAGTTSPLPAAGTLDGPSVTKFRDDIQIILNDRFPDARVTVSLYVAGKMTQILGRDRTALNQQLGPLQGAFNSAAAQAHLPAVRSCRLIALVGASLIDDTLTSRLKGAGGPAIAKQFFLDSTGAEWNALQTLLGNQSFLDAQTALISIPEWTFGCFQRFTFYTKFTMLAN